MCRINILYVYVFNITSSLINIHVVNHAGGCSAISTSPRPGGSSGKGSCCTPRSGLRPRPPFPVWHRFPPSAPCRALGTAAVPPGQGDGPRWAGGPALRAAPSSGAPTCKAKGKSCPFLDPSPSAFNFLASAYCCCTRAPT